jgi:hypothetical protein
MSTMPQRSTSFRFWGWPRLPPGCALSLAPSCSRMAFSTTALPSASGSATHWVKMLAPRPRMALALRFRLV